MVYYISNINNFCPVFFSRNSWLQCKSVLHLWTCQDTSSFQSRHHETAFWTFTQVCFFFFFKFDPLHVSIKQMRTFFYDSSHQHPVFFLWQGHSMRGGQSHDCAECGDCVRPDSAAARDGVGQHHHAHGLSEPDSGVHPERIRAYLLLQLKRSEASGADLGKRRNVLKLFEVLDLPFACTHTHTHTASVQHLKWNSSCKISYRALQVFFARNIWGLTT